jgi:hypothetical protein
LPAEPIIESSPSQSDYSDTRKNLIEQRKQRAQLGHATSDTEDDDNIDDDELADQVDSKPDLPNLPHSMAAREDKQKAPLKRGPLSAEAKEEIHAFSTQVLEMAQELADRLRILRKNVLISAGLGIKESRSENIANMHRQWYATTHPKPQGSKYSYFRLSF